MKNLMILMILLITLNGCVSSKYVPQVVTDFSFIRQTVPAELLEPALLPDPSILSRVKVTRGKDILSAYGTAVIDANYENRQKLAAIKAILK